MIIICINRPQDTIRAADVRKRWSRYGEVLFLPATQAIDCNPEKSVRKRLLSAGEVACRRSHNRAVSLVKQIGQTCCVIEDDAIPKDGFEWPQWDGEGRLLLFHHGGESNKWGAVASLVSPECQQIPEGHAADWWPENYPVETHRIIVDHRPPLTSETTIRGRAFCGRKPAKQLILGLGSGRCGTMSLALMLKSAGVNCTHEMNPSKRHGIIGWNQPGRAALAAHKILARPSPVVGDVSFWWLPHLPYLRSLYPDMKTFAIRRDSEDCVDSWERKLGGKRNHWKPGQRDPWSICFPKFLEATTDFRSGARRYLDYYYRVCQELGVKIFDIDDLNSEEGVGRILRHLGLRGGGLPGIVENRSLSSDDEHAATSDATLEHI